MKFNVKGQVQFSTVLGGEGTASRTRINGVRTSGDVVFVAGSTTATDFATKGPIQAQNGGSADIFVCALNNRGTLLEFSTYLGGTGSESVLGLDLDASGSLYLVGGTESPNFPYTGNAAEQPVANFNGSSLLQVG